jgi:hypothetical protein
MREELIAPENAEREAAAALIKAQQGAGLSKGGYSLVYVGEKLF